MMNHLKDLIKTISVVLFPAYFRKRQYRFLESINWQQLPPEESELLLIKYFLTGDKTFFDIGANIGIYTRYAQNFIPAESIYAFEPIPELYIRIKFMLWNSKIHKLALSDVTGRKKMKIPSIFGREYKSRGTLNLDYKEDGETRSRIIKINTDSIDHFVNKHNISNIGFIKIDVEGHEHLVISGGIKTITMQHPALQIEIEQRHHTQNIYGIINHVVNLGYKCYYLNHDRKELTILDKNPQEIQNLRDFKTNRYVHNFIFLPDNLMWEERVTIINQELRLQWKNATSHLWHLTFSF